MKKITTLLAVGCAVGMLTGCGIPEEEHNAIVDGIMAQNQEQVDQLNATIGDQKDIIDSEKAKNRQNRIELDDASERINDLQQKNAETAKMLAAEKSKVATLESQLRTALAETEAALAEALEAENKLNTLDVEYQDLNRRFEMFKKNMSALSSSAPAKSTAAPAASAAPASSMTAPATDAEKASALLDQMGTL